MPKRTHQPKTRKRKRVHGWRARSSAKGGKKTIKARRRKQRSKLTA